MNKRRTQQVAGEVRRAVQEVISKGLSDPRVRGMITVTEVTLSDDLRTATLMVSVMPEEHEQLTMHGLRAASRYIRREAGELVAMARLPELVFKGDKRFKRQASVLDAIAKARKELPDADSTATDQTDPHASDTGANETPSDANPQERPA